MTNVVRFPTEQCRLPGETRETFAQRQADEQFWQANFAADPKHRSELYFSLDAARGADKSVAVIYYIGDNGHLYILREGVCPQIV